MMKQTTVVQWRMTAAMLRMSNTKLEAIPHCLKVKQQTGWRQRRGGCPNKQGSLGKRSQERVGLHCQAPRAVQASAGHVSRLPGQLSQLVVSSRIWAFRGFYSNTTVFKNSSTASPQSRQQMKTHTVTLYGDVNNVTLGNKPYVQSVCVSAAEKQNQPGRDVWRNGDKSMKKINNSEFVLLLRQLCKISQVSSSKIKGGTR